MLASAATGIVGFIEKFGGDVDRIFGDAGILPDMAGAPTLKLKLSAFCQLFEESARQTGHEQFRPLVRQPVQAARPRPVGLCGGLGAHPRLGAGESRRPLPLPPGKLGDAARRAARDGLMRLEYQITAPAIVERRQDAELSLGMFLNFFRECCGPPGRPRRCISSTRSRRSRRSTKWPSTRRSISRSRPTRCSSAPRFCRGRCRRPTSSCSPSCRPAWNGSARSRRAEDLLLDRVRTAVRVKLPEGYPALEEVADELRVPVGAICRDLHHAGTTYTELVEGVRRDLALSYVRQRQLPFSEIAMLLGYSELSAFSRAFRRWTGASSKGVARAGRSPARSWQCASKGGMSVTPRIPQDRIRSRRRLPSAAASHARRSRI